ncbi:MAG: serA [Dehalococcoidia bacterium]|nr:serA [Dehalococcoidia bacterium]
MKVLVADPIAAEGIDLLRQRVTVDVKTGLKAPELLSIIGDYDGLVVRSETRVTAEVIEAGKKLQVIARAGVGVDNIDLQAATRKGIMVVNAPAGNIISAAEHTLAMMLALARLIPQANNSLKSGKWHRTAFTGTEVRGKTLGIVGLGNVGSELARRMRAFQMRLIAHDPFVSIDYARNLGVELVSLEALLKEADFVTLHVPLTSSTKSIIGPRELALMKPTARIINCARGGIVDEEALYRALEDGKLAGAAFDVFTVEPAVDNILLKSDKVVVTPHLAASTAEAQVSVAVDAAEQVIAILEGRPARYTVNAPLIPAETLAALAPFMAVGHTLGRLLSQLMAGQLNSVRLSLEGEVAQYDTATLKATILCGLLERVTEERLNIVNVGLIAAQRGINVVEQKSTACENYASLITLEASTSKGVNTVAGTFLRGETHIVRINNYWTDFIPTGGFFLFSDHKDRPGLIGAVGSITGKANINISFMQVARLKPRGEALMILGLDEPLGKEAQEQLLAIPDVYSVRNVKL